MNRVAGMCVAAAWALASFRAAPALACGGGGVTSRVGVTMNAQRIFMSVRANGTTDIVAQIAVPQTTADYGVLIPVPDEPTLDSEPVSAADLNALDDATAPQIFSETEDSGGHGCGCVTAGANTRSTKAPTRDVTVSRETTIGPVVALSLTGESGDGVRGWLADNGFALPDDDASTLDRYVGNGKYFIAIRRKQDPATGSGATVGAGNGGPSSIGIHYTLKGDHRMLSLGFTRIGAAPKIAITLFLAAPQIVGPSQPFKALTLEDLAASTLRSNDYALAVENAVAGWDSKAFVLESSKPIAAIASRAPGLAQFVDKGALVVRATTVLAREKIDEDVVFTTPFSGTLPSERFVRLGGEGVRYAGMGSLAWLLLAAALRRGTRTRPCAHELNRKHCLISIR